MADGIRNTARPGIKCDLKQARVLMARVNVRDAAKPRRQENGRMPQQGTKKSLEKNPTKTLSLVKGDQQFCFRYEVGEEAKVLEALISMVNRRELAFDWFDAAVLSHQLGQHLAKELKAYLPKKAA